MEQVIGQIQAFGFNFEMKDWAFCNGQILSIAQNTALFSLIGTTFGGNGTQTFALPDLRGRSIVHPGQGPGLSSIAYGEVGGSENVTLSANNMPMHNHILASGPGQVTAITTINTNSTGTPGNDPDNGNGLLGSSGSFPNIYSDNNAVSSSVGGAVTTISGATATAGGSQPFSNRSPYLGIYTSIALYGIFPSRN